MRRLAEETRYAERLRKPATIIIIIYSLCRLAEETRYSRADWLRKPYIHAQTGWGNQIFTRRLAEETRYSRADWLRKPEIYYLLCADWLRKPDIHYANWLIKPDIHYSDYIIFFTIIFFIKRLHKAWIINGWILFEKYYLQDIICGFFNICPLIVANNWDLVI